MQSLPASANAHGLPVGWLRSVATHERSSHPLPRSPAAAKPPLGNGEDDEEVSVCVAANVQAPTGKPWGSIFSQVQLLAFRNVRIMAVTCEPPMPQAPLTDQVYKPSLLPVRKKSIFLSPHSAWAITRELRRRSMVESERDDGEHDSVTVVIRDDEVCRRGDVLDTDTAMTLIAVASEDPSCWEEMIGYWPRYRTPWSASSLTVCRSRGRRSCDRPWRDQRGPRLGADRSRPEANCHRPRSSSRSGATRRSPSSWTITAGNIVR